MEPSNSNCVLGTRDWTASAAHTRDTSCAEWETRRRVSVAATGPRNQEHVMPCCAQNPCCYAPLHGASQSAELVPATVRLSNPEPRAVGRGDGLVRAPQHNPCTPWVSAGSARRVQLNEVTMGELYEAATAKRAALALPMLTVCGSAPLGTRSSHCPTHRATVPHRGARHPVGERRAHTM